MAKQKQTQQKPKQKHTSTSNIGSTQKRQIDLKNILSNSPLAKKSFVFLIVDAAVLFVVFLLVAIFAGLQIYLAALILGSVGLGLLLASFIAIALRYRAIVLNRNAVADSLINQMEAFRLGEGKVSDVQWPLNSSRRVQTKLNETILYANTVLEEKHNREGGRAYTKEVLPFNEFLEKCPIEVSLNSSHLSAVVFFSLVSDEPLTKGAKEALKKLVRETFPDDLMFSNNDTYGAYVYSIPSKSAFSAKCEKLVSTFSYTEVKPNAAGLSVYGCRIGGAYYPGFGIQSLAYAARRALMRSKGVELDEGKAPRADDPFSSTALSETCKRVEALSYGNYLAAKLMRATDLKQEREADADLVRFYCDFSGFDCAGAYFYDETAHLYQKDVHYERADNILGFGRLGDRVPEEILNPFYDLATDETPYFCNNVSSLDREVSQRLTSLGIETFYLFPIAYHGKKMGLFYFASPHVFDLPLLTREKLHEFLPQACTSLWLTKADADHDAIAAEINTIASRNELYLYTIDRSSYTLLRTTNNMVHKIKGMQLGLPCYQTLYGLDGPCENCPLSQGASKRFVPAIANKEIRQSVLSFRQGDNFSTIVLENGDEKNASSSLIDRALLIKNSKAFAIDTNREFRNDFSTGYFLAIHLANKSHLLSTLRNQNINSLMASIAREIGGIGYDDASYRFDADTIVVHFPNIRNRTTIYLSIESIAEQIRGPLYAGEDTFIPKYNYSLISYPSDVSSSNDLETLIHTELARSVTMGEGVVAEVGRSKGRKAYRPQYIENLLQDELRDKNVGLVYSPIANPATQEVHIIRALPSLTGEAKEKIRESEFIHCARDHGMMEPLDAASLRQALSFYQANKENFFDPNGITYLLYRISTEMLASPTGLGKLADIKRDFDIPDNFLLLAISSKRFLDQIETLAPKVEELHRLGYSLLIENYYPGSISLRQLSSYGIEGFITDPRFLSEALNDESERLLFTNYAKEAKALHLIEFIDGITSEDGRKFCKGLGIPFVMGSHIGKDMPEAELLTSLSYKK